jgi:hypothetical protein
MAAVDRTMRIWTDDKGNVVLARQDHGHWALFDPAGGQPVGHLDDKTFNATYALQNTFADPDKRRENWTIALETPDLLVISDRRPIHGPTDSPHLLVIPKSTVAHLDNWCDASLSVRRQLDLVIVAFGEFCESRGLGPIAFGNDSPSDPNLKNPRQEVQNVHAHLAAAPLHPAPGEGGFKVFTYKTIALTGITDNWSGLPGPAGFEYARTPYCWFKWGDGPVGIIDPLGAGANEFHRQIASAWGLGLFEDPTLTAANTGNPPTLNLRRPSTTITLGLVRGFGEFVRSRRSLAAALADPNYKFAEQFLRRSVQLGVAFG